MSEELAEDDVDEDPVYEIPETTGLRVKRRLTRASLGRRARVQRMSREEMRVGALMYPPTDDERPRTRGECREELRPCPWVACKFHLYLDVNPETGSIKVNFPDQEPWELTTTCALDVAERGGVTLEEVGEIMNLTRERIRQVEVKGLLKLKMGSPSEDELGAALIQRPLVQIRRRK